MDLSNLGPSSAGHSNSTSFLSSPGVSKNKKNPKYPTNHFIVVISYLHAWQTAKLAGKFLANGNEQNILNLVLDIL